MPSTLNGREQVLCIPRSALNPVLGPTAPGRPRRFLTPEQVDGAALVKALSFATFKARTAELERDTAWLQAIPYGMLCCSGHVLMYERPARQGDARLRKRRSLGVGGHVNPVDVTRAPAIADIFQALGREVVEELNPRPGAVTGSALCGLIHDESDAVGAVHLGFACVVGLIHPTLIRPGPEVIPVGWFDQATLEALGPVNVDRLEGWSKACRDWLVGSESSPLRATAAVPG